MPLPSIRRGSSAQVTSKGANATNKTVQVRVTTMDAELEFHIDVSFSGDC